MHVRTRPAFRPRLQEGKLDDMRAMLGLLEGLGLNTGTYFRQQVHSALISAALAGQLDLMLLLQRTSQPLMAAALQEKAGAAGAAAAAGQGSDGSGGHDTSEL